MLKVTVDGVEIEVPQGATVLQACLLRARHLVFACAVALCAPTVALAQPDTGHIYQQYDRAKLDEGEADAIEAQQAIYDYGACLAKARRRQVERYLATDPFAGSAQSIARHLVMSACLEEGEINFNPEAIRGPFYQALYRLDFQYAPAIDLKTVAPLDYSYAAGNPGVTANLRRFADCVVRQDPASARSLAFSRIGSPQEKAAFRALMPAMGTCIAPGDKVAFKYPLLRAVFNEVLYRLTAASVGRAMSMDRK